MNIEQKPGSLGHCYSDAFEYVRVNGGILVHGTATVTGNGRQPSIPHAWVVLNDGTVFDPAALYGPLDSPEPGIWPVVKRSRNRPDCDYSITNSRLRERFRYSRDEALTRERQTGGTGPWEGYYWKVDDRNVVVRK